MLNSRLLFFINVARQAKTVVWFVFLLYDAVKKMLGFFKILLKLANMK